MFTKVAVVAFSAALLLGAPPQLRGTHGERRPD